MYRARNDIFRIINIVLFFRSIKPELNKIREQIPLPMEHAKSSYEASQHFIPPYPPRNDDIWQDNGMPPATSSAKPKVSRTNHSSQ